MAIPRLRRLRTSLEGVLAGGADPSGSALYSFQAFVAVIAAAGIGSAASGLSLWLVVVALVAATIIYGLVMRWVPKGEGGNGLSEEEFGAWAIKVNGGVTFILFVVAFLVSTASAATFLADRLPAVQTFRMLGVEGRAWLAIVLTLALAWLSNNRPRMLGLAYGPATAAVLVLLWAMVAASVATRGIGLPGFEVPAAQPLAFFGVALAGFARLLAMLTGIEVFATLVPAFEGGEPERRRRAFGSLLLVIVTSIAVLLFLGPTIVAVTGTQQPVSVFTQAMDALLPAPLPAVGTAIAVAVLVVVAFACAQGLQNLVLGLRDRHYAPAFLGQRNRSDVPDWPVRMLAVAVIACYALLGADASLYVRVYVAGFMLLLTITAWAAVKRSWRQVRASSASVLWVALTGLSAMFLSASTAVVLIEGFLAGTFIYLVLVPIFFLIFHYTRRAMGSPNPLRDELGRKEESMRSLGRPPRSGALKSARSRLPAPEMVPTPEAPDRGAAQRWSGEPARMQRVMLALDGSDFAERALPASLAICKLFDASLILVSVLPARGALRVLSKGRSSGNPLEAGQAEIEAYLNRLSSGVQAQGVRVDTYVASGPVAQALDLLARELDVQVLVMSTHGRSGVSRFMLGSNASATIQVSTRPVLLLRTQALAGGGIPQLNTILAPLDGSSFAEQALPWLHAIASVSSAEIVLLAVPEIPEPAQFGAMYDSVDELRERAETNARTYVEAVATQMRAFGATVRTIVAGSRPATTILDVAERERADLIMLATHGRGGMERLVMGSVADRVVHHATCPVFLLPVHETRGGEKETRRQG